jgi:hypothetical protein
MKGKHTQIIIELIAWSAFLGFPVILFPTFMPLGSGENMNPALAGVLLTHSLLIGFYYFNFYYAIPRFYFKRRFTTYGPVMLASVTIIILILLLNPGFNPFPSPPFRYPVFIFILSILVRFIVVFLFSLGIANIKRLESIEKEKISAELSYLKAQLNPHFLFNTLNSIYALTVKKSDHAPESVMKLSSIMRYVVTEAESETVDLEKELNYISSYIQLEKLRLTGKVLLTYDVEGDATGMRIAPLIFIPIIENAFKHGVSTSEPSSIVIRILIDEKQLHLLVSNSKQKSKKAGTGRGLANVRKRLSLLYPGKHDLRINESEKDYSVNLTLDLHA